jgi:hypothetical protein
MLNRSFFDAEGHAPGGGEGEFAIGGGEGEF